MSTGRVVQVNVSNGGVPKMPISEGYVGALGIAGDGHNDKRFHGGPDRALCLFSLEVIEALQSEGHPIAPGSTGENLTISGIDWSTVQPGNRYRIGDVELEITGYTSPCDKNAVSFKNGEFTRMSQKLHPGFSRVYARVLQEGTVRSGAEITQTHPA
jgi:MOSC domain-containing protein YiiM